MTWSAPGYATSMDRGTLASSSGEDLNGSNVVRTAVGAAWRMPPRSCTAVTDPVAMASSAWSSWSLGPR